MSKKEWGWFILGVILVLPIMLMFPQILSADGSDIQTFDFGVLMNSFICAVSGLGFCIVGCVLYEKRKHKVIWCAVIAIAIVCFIISFAL